MIWFFELLSVCDSITPAKGFIEDVVNDPTPFGLNSWTFFVGDSSLAPGQIKSLLRENNIHYWGGQTTGGEFFFDVPKDQAHKAECLLAQYGVGLSMESQGAPIVHSMNSSYQTAMLTIVPAPSIWGLLIRWIFR